MKKIVVATNNHSKLEEIKEILNEYKLLSLKDVECNINVLEDKETFKENSHKKAKEISDTIKMPCISDDSGLCINEYNGWPGVYTARFLGEDASARQRNEYILNKMKDLKGEKRNAVVKCHISYYENSQFIDGIGEVKGRISEEIRGENGFGFDEIFEIKDGRTLAELSKEEKNNISARKLALMNLLEKMKKEKKNVRG